jgi:DNA-binding response OmpR family regulator
LVQELIELHHGTINVTSSPGQGSCFTLRIPLGKEYLAEDEVSLANDVTQLPTMKSAAPDTTGPNYEPANQEQACVLIIEDNDDLRNYLLQSLKDKYNVLVASNGQEGLRIAFEEVPDLILSDLMMPKMDGLELCRQIKSNEKTSHIVVILLTAKADQGTRINGFETGADDYLTKPFSLPELNARIQNMIDSRKKLRQIFSTALILKPSDIKAVSLDDKFMKRVMEIIEAHLPDTSFSVEILAGEIGMSSVQLYRKLKAISGQTPNDVIRNVRLERAASLFEQRAGHVADVAYSVGFNSLSYFSKCFREKFGRSPSDYLKSVTEKY